MVRQRGQQLLFTSKRSAVLELIDVDGQQVEISPVFETYWRFAAERQAIFCRRVAGTKTLTHDPILARYKFTNAYRASDRVSQYLIRNVIYSDNFEPPDLLFRILLFKLFNSIETWERLEQAVGGISISKYDFATFDRVLSEAMEKGARIYSSAYIMPTSRNEARKHRSHLRLLEAMLADRLHDTISTCRTMEEAFLALRSYPMIGNFLAYQFITDLNYSPLCDFSESEFVVPGPGALDGIRKCFPGLAMENASHIVRWMAANQKRFFQQLELDFETLGGRPLQYIDCQNLFCEVDKYSRVAHPEIAGLSGRLRIKQHYKPSSKPLGLFYPPKWGINDKIQGCIMQSML